MVACRQGMSGVFNPNMLWRKKIGGTVQLAWDWLG